MVNIEKLDPILGLIDMVVSREGNIQSSDILELLQDKEVQEQIAEVARGFFSNGTVTVNIIPALLIAGAIAAFFALGGFALFSKQGGGDTGGGSYTVITDDYGAPSTGYGAPDAGYGAPSGGYDAPSDGYGAGRRRREVLSADQKDIFKNLVASSEEVNPVPPKI